MAGPRIQIFDRDGATPLTGLTLSRIAAGATGTARKLWVKNVGDRAMGEDAGFEPFTLAGLAVEGNDGIGRLRWKADGGGSIPPPWGGEAEVAAGAGTFGSTGTKAYVIVALKGSGKTIGSDRILAVIAATTDEVDVSWENVPGNDGYEVHFSDDPDDFSSTTLLATVAQDVTTYHHDGTAAGAGIPPSENTTGGAAPEYGTPPAGLNTATTPELVGSDPGNLAQGEMWPFWINRVVPSNSIPDGNDRAVDLRFSEVG